MRGKKVDASSVNFFPGIGQKCIPSGFFTVFFVLLVIFLRKMLMVRFRSVESDGIQDFCHRRFVETPTGIKVLLCFFSQRPLLIVVDKNSTPVGGAAILELALVVRRIDLLPKNIQ